MTLCAEGLSDLEVGGGQTEVLQSADEAWGQLSPVGELVVLGQTSLLCGNSVGSWDANEP